MKFLLLVAAVACQGFAFTSRGVCQQKEPQADRPYLQHAENPRLYFFSPPTRTSGRVELAASSAQLDPIGPLGLSSAEVESVLQLRGSVEVLMCSLGTDGCGHSSLVLHADAVDYNEKTREIHAHGDVRIVPYQRHDLRNTIVPR